MSLGSAPTTKIDIDFTRAQGSASKGRILFQPPRQKVGQTMLSNFSDPAELIAGKATVELARLPLGTYRAIEQIDGLAQRHFDFALPLNSPAEIRYEDIVPVAAVPARYTTVKTINGVPPNQTTGDIVVELGGGPHNHTTSEITDFSSASTALINTAIQSLIGSAPAALNTLNELAAALGNNENFSTDMLAFLAGKAALIHEHSISDITGLESIFNGISSRALPDRILRIADHSKTAGGANTYDMPNTGGSWELFVGGPPEYTIPASVGDDIQVAYSYLIAGASNSYADLAVVTGATPTRQRYLSSGIGTPSFQGASGNYPSGAGFEGRSGTLGFIAEASDIDSGNIRLRWTIKTSTADGKMYANDNYPLMLSIRNTRLSGL